MTIPLWKTTRADRRRVQRKRMRHRKLMEHHAKLTVRDRDIRCRFPMCGCQVRGFRLEVSHQKHKAMGGNPLGDRSVPELLVLLCQWRHQHGRISRHAGTLRPVFLTEDGYNGPIAWEVDISRCRCGSMGGPEPVWEVVGTETAVGVWAPFTAWQESVLRWLAQMEE